MKTKTMANKLLILDKDGTIVKPKNAAKFVKRPWLQTPIDGVSKVLEKYCFQNWKIVLCSNQAGIQANHKTWESAIFEFEYCFDLFPQISEAFFCPDFEGRLCLRMWRNDNGYTDADHQILYNSEQWDESYNFRKPAPGMLQLINDIFIPEESLFVGDYETDGQAAGAARINFMYRDAWLKST